MEHLIKKFKEKLEMKNNKKFINNLFIFLIILIIFLIGMNILFGDRDKESSNEELPLEKDDIANDYSSELENRLIGILKKFKDVGEVDVMITFEDGIETVSYFN